MRNVGRITVYGSVEDSALDQMINCMDVGDTVRGALMADHHKGYAMPIGGVIAYKDSVSPSGCGYDIGCGNKAVRLDVDPEYVIKNISKIMDDIHSNISFGIGQKNNTKVDCELFDLNIWNRDALRGLKDMARQQLGTVGSGNHYVDVFLSDDNNIWIGVHFGSRGLGHKIATYYLKAGGAKDGMDVDPLVLPASSDLGANYILDMTTAGEYAKAGRDWVCQKVAEMIGGEILEEIHNHHNYAWREKHGDEEYWVVRKGATPAFPNQKGFIGASMGEDSVIIEGVEHESCYNSLYSTVHGAGRVMGRMEAKGKIDRKTGEVKREGKVSKEMMRNWIDGANVELRGGDVDESPHCYKRLPDVLECHSDSIRILHTLKPLGVAMAGKGDIDPYKD